MGTGETVAVKQVKLADLPKSELRVITLEIDLLKNLDHPNIVKYRGFVKSADSLNIILEYCENGSPPFYFQKLWKVSREFGRHLHVTGSPWSTLPSRAGGYSPRHQRR